MASNDFDCLSQKECECMHAFAASLNEKDRRRYAAVEAMKWGYGGIAYIARVIGCSRRTIERGKRELGSLDQDPAEGRIRCPGAGRKKKLPSNRKLSRT
jgi:hypothetical protein